MRHFVAVSDVSAQELQYLITTAEAMKAAWSSGRRDLTMSGRCMALLFEKPSLRTRVSFEAAMEQLGGSCIFINAVEVGLGVRESISDFARVISQYVDVLVARVHRHEQVKELCRHATVPIINGLSDLAHPCQALADLLTVRELFGQIEGRTLVFVGDGNNVARSLAMGCRAAGARFVLAAPPGYEFPQEFLDRLHRTPGSGSVRLLPDPAAAVVDADVIYTDVWTSMGQEAETDRRRRAFVDYQVNLKLLGLAPEHVRVMHCLPAHRGEEITEEVIDGPKSVVVLQAANRLHAQKALLVWLLANVSNQVAPPPREP